MRILLKATVGIAAFVLFITGIGLCWFYFYSGDIPHFAGIADFSPASPTTAVDECSSTAITVVPYSYLGQSLRDATRTAEGDDRVLSIQIARRMLCNYRGKMLQRQVLEYKASIQLRHQFTSEQLLAMYLNRAYFGDGVVGIEGVCQRHYGKSASDLDVSQAAMIAGLLKAPSMYSPERHPDRARARRDAIITQMLRNGVITPAQAQTAMAASVR